MGWRPAVAAPVLATLSAILLPLSFAGSAAGQVPAPASTDSGTAGFNPSFGLRAGLYGQTTLEDRHFQYAVHPGASVQDSVDVLNLTAEQHTFRLYGADLIQGRNGGLAPTFPEDKQRDAGAWIHLDRSSVTLGPSGKQKIDITVNVPEDATPGDHLGAVVASAKAQPKPGAFAVESRVALMVRVRIPGVAKLDGVVGTLRVASGRGDRRFTVEVHNTGNLLLTLIGRIEVKNGNNTVATLPVKPANIYIIPAGTARFTANWTGTPLFGKRTARAVFTMSAFREHDITRSSNHLSLSFFSWLFIVLLLVLFVGASGGLVARGRKGGDKPPPAEGIRPEPERRSNVSADDHADSREWYS